MLKIIWLCFFCGHPVFSNNNANYANTLLCHLDSLIVSNFFQPLLPSVAISRDLTYQAMSLKFRIP